jgi:apolipoprotein D and lipocalin family protein
MITLGTSMNMSQLCNSSTRSARLRIVALLAATTFLSGCLGMPSEVEPVKEFEADRFLGVWYEIARLDHSFERDLVNVTAEYSRRDDGAVRVFNRGFDTKDDDWSEIEGVARFVGSESEGHLKVSFFGPFYSSYVVFDIDREAYRYAFISGFNHDYLWLLSREPTVPDALKEQFVREARERGFAVDDVIWVEQSTRQ